MRVATWNVGNRSDDKVLRGLLRLARTHTVIALQETADRHRVTRQFCRDTGWTAIHGDKDGKGRTCLLVAPGHKVTDVGWTELSPRTDVGPWGAGPSTIGRKWIAHATVDGLPVGVVHFVPSVQRPALTPKARRQRKERRGLWYDQARAVINWAGNRECIVLGDLNATKPYPGTDVLRRHFELHTRRSRGMRAIDYILARGVTVGGVQSLDGYPSDHRPVVGTITH